MPKKITLSDLKAKNPLLGDDYIEHHLASLDEPYLQCFNLDEISQHIERLSQLTLQNPIQVIITKQHHPSIECTFLTYNYSSLFSILTGMLAGLGFEIVSGDIFTYRAYEAPKKMIKSARDRETFLNNPLNRRLVIDRFIGKVHDAYAFDVFEKKLLRHLHDVFSVFKRQDTDSIYQAKRMVHHLVAQRLSKLSRDTSTVLYPVQIEVDDVSLSQATRLIITSQDTPAFLYSLAYALAHHGISIEHVQIHTQKNQIQDTLDIVHADGTKITNEKELAQIKLFIMLTKQFTYFLDRAADPFSAIQRFEQLLNEIVLLPEEQNWISFLSNGHALQDLARLLGASDYLWEDFIRLQYESLIPILKTHLGSYQIYKGRDYFTRQLDQLLSGASSYDQKKDVINHFKDQSLFIIDLDHILNQSNFKRLAHQLSFLAELILTKATTIIYDFLIQRYGVPNTVGGISAEYILCGLGKMGGKALGYASDIEVMLIYSDSGYTDGAEKISNAEFFEKMVQELSTFIQTKRDGIFQLDFRLRPYGNDGPLAVSLESFCDYYGIHGKAMFYEKVALTRLRTICSQSKLGRQIERLRDQYIYHLPQIPTQELWDIRKKQFLEKQELHKLNAKFSPGGLVDIEYTVQLLQMMYASHYPKLKSSSIYTALSTLQKAQILSFQDRQKLIHAYNFLRILINGLRLIRGSAKDLFLPPLHSLEYSHLARRIGFIGTQTIDASSELHIEVETQMAIVRSFVEKYFSKEFLPSEHLGTIADIIISDTLPLELRNTILKASGFSQSEKAYTNLKYLAGEGEQKEIFIKIAVLAVDYINQNADPDMALNNWERFVAVLDHKQAHFELLLKQPKRLELLLTLFSISHSLTDTLIRYPHYFDWATDPAILYKSTRKVWMNRHFETQKTSLALNQFKRQEILRIGIRDLCLNYSLKDITMDLSDLADFLIQDSFAIALSAFQKHSSIPNIQDHVCILALGKLGARELNYSSDIDLVAVFDEETLQDDLTTLITDISHLLSDYSEEGYVYRVDFRLRPFGISGPLLSLLDSLVDYYMTHAMFWEIQALLKCRPVAGNCEIGKIFLKRIRPLLTQKRDPKMIIDSIHMMRTKAIKHYHSDTNIDIKNNSGGIRDIEFMVQGLQLIYLPQNPHLLVADTLTALDTLNQTHLISETVYLTLKENYCYFRRIEHFLQLFEDRAIRHIPKKEHELALLAKRILGPSMSGAYFMDDLVERMRQVRKCWKRETGEGEN